MDMTRWNGRHPAKGVEAALGYTAGGKEQVAVRFNIIDGPCKGDYITWHGYFTEQTTERTLESLRLCGWEGDDLFDLTGIDRNEVSLVIEVEEYEGKQRPKVQFVNGVAGLALKERMSEGDARAFSQRMKGAVIASKKRQGQSRSGGGNRPAGARHNAPPPSDEDAPF